MPDAEGQTRPAKPETFDLSPMTFGTMRLDRVGGVDRAADLIRAAIVLGVTTFHVSHEYATWPLFKAAWRQAAPNPDMVRLIAKVGVPHFGEDRFDPQGFRDRVDAYREDLNLDRIHLVQWLLRHDLKAETARQAIFDRDAEMIGDVVQALKQAGRIEGLISFPYTAEIAGRALKASWCDGLALYCNALELEMTDWFDEAEAWGKVIVAIRPFGAGRILEETGISSREALALPLAHPAVATAVASVSSVSRLREAIEAAASAPRGRDAWTAAMTKAREAVHV